MSETRAALLLVSHSEQLANGLAALAAQMAPNVTIKTAAGTADGRLGTSYDKVDDTLSEMLEAGSVVVLTDLGSATLTAESVLEFLEDEPVVFADAPFVEGAVAAAVAAQGGGDASTVAQAARQAAQQWGAPSEPEPQAESEEDYANAQAVTAQATIHDPAGLHARPAAKIARVAANYDAVVTINEVEADSVLSVMGLGLKDGDTVTVVARGPQAEEALDNVVNTINETQKDAQ
ncbi:dihydroxyacetone kinase phosphoryl donor subunit DhaM [Gleimia hominis]|uniref:Phosphocarrier protein HPr n=1 Tax=Gleimia hominis TaxID=595468 RepID=A0ABU3IC28_9ACTO|nr:dihydroxyacetone kinase phosphoryl donor subunit DhaM [Gleimia hominis]MDT3767936.1 dihydroxyacetone kinase phosphoryl donor subunit DhaM [Gleimia hominis]